MSNFDEKERLKYNEEQTCSKKIMDFEYRPVATIVSTVTCCIAFGLIFCALGIILLIVSSLVKEITIRYDDIEQCDKFFNNSYNKSLVNLGELQEEIKDLLNITLFDKERKCEIQFTLFETMSPPINVYYELDNFYQNHRRFIQSRNIAQLSGSIFNASDLKLECDPIITVKELGINKTFGGYYLSDDAPANPCGLYARAFFNDTYKLLNNTKNDVFINETNIAWPSDRDNRFKLPLNAERIQWINVTDEHFMVWMRPASTNKFRKLWGRIDKELSPGNYTLQVVNNYKVSDFKGKKSFVLSTSSFLGGKNTFLGTAYIVLGVICLLTSAIFSIAYKNKVSSDKKNT
jgi:hypothetical protein